MNIVGYEPAATPGAYNFATKDGRKFMAFGAEAEAMKARLDQAKAAGPQPTANVAADLLSASTNPVAAAMNAPKVARAFASDAPAPSPAAAPDPAPKVDYAFGPNAPGEGQPASAPVAAAPAAPTGPRPLGLGYFEDPATGMIMQWDPGSAGSRGGMVERGRTIRGGFEEDEAYKAAKWELAQAKLGEVDKARAEQAEAFEAEQALLQDQRVMQNDALMEEQQRVRDIEAGVKAAEAQRVAALKDYTGAKVDPRRALSGGKNWLYGLMAGLGTFGAGLSKTPNYSVQVLNQRIADDIAAQEKEIAIKRDAADNALSDLTRKLGSQDRAKVALAQIQNQLAQNSLAQHASRTKDADQRSRAEQMRLTLQEQFLDLAEQDRRLATGEVTTSIVNMPGSAPRAPGFRPVGNQLATGKGLVDIANAKKDAAGGGKAPGEVAPARTTKIAQNSAVIEDAEAVLSDLPAGESEWDDPTSGPVDYLFGDKAKQRRIEERTDKLGTGIQTGSGMGSSDDDAKRAKEQAAAGGSLSERRRGAQTAAEAAAQRIAFEISALPPDQQGPALQALPPASRAHVLRVMQK